MAISKVTMGFLQSTNHYISHSIKEEIELSNTTSLQLEPACLHHVLFYKGVENPLKLDVFLKVFN